ncbi:MAG: type II toxin-antitoxin system HicA family toxin [Symbiobacteriia bacterium]
MASWKDLKRFCERDQWELYKSTDHDFYRKLMPDRTLKRTKVSRGTGQINGELWQRILNQQLKVTQEYFNSKLR